MKNIVTVFGLKNDKKLYLDFARLVDLDSMNKDAFFGRTKVYASEKEIPRRKINSRTEVVYAE